MVALRPSRGWFSVFLISVCSLLFVSDFALLSRVAADELSVEETEAIAAFERAIHS